MKRFPKQHGQGMTEYIIIVALIAIAAIAAYSFFGDTLRSQVGGMAAELGGQSGAANVTAAGVSANAGAAAGTTAAGLDNYATGAAAN
ncbi:MAG: Flp pilus assembly pilin Flp [Gammaproteobacteria bacterium]|jgi:Flp pilus assembly pilin Flp